MSPTAKPCWTRGLLPVRGRAGACVTLSALFFLLLPAVDPAKAHNASVIHPEITFMGLRAVRVEDFTTHGVVSPDPMNPCQAMDPVLGTMRLLCSYQELWDNAGALQEPNRDIDDVDGNEAQYEQLYNQGDRSVITGSVMEDIPVTRVAEHFFHARTGTTLLNRTDYTASDVRAQELFSFGLALHDYDPDSQTLSYFYLGRFLHHVEDMSSPAHTHNDAHLVSFLGYDTEEDDYEARYVPRMWVANEVRPILENATPHSVDELRDIYPVPNAGMPPPNTALSARTYNWTLYQATLPLPPDNPPTTAASGELAMMFPDDPGDPMNNGLYWQDPMIGGPRWVIDGVGEYIYSGPLLPDGDDWFSDISTDGTNDPLPDDVSALYYIEQLMAGDEQNTSVIPANMRADLRQPWDATMNPVQPNTERITQQQADLLLLEAGRFVAGAAKHWFDVANLPPYLKAVRVHYEGMSELLYEGEWGEAFVTTMLSLPEYGLVSNTTTDEEIESLDNRYFIFDDAERKPIGGTHNVILELEFNEPIREITELRLLQGGQEELDLKTLVEGQMTPANVPLLSDNDRIWTYTLESAGLVDLNGLYTLSVKAVDMHNHFGGTGAELDETPATPAKRQVTLGDLQHADIDPGYPWHTAATSSQKFTYDFANGDRNHILFFDTVPPTVDTSISKAPIF